MFILHLLKYLKYRIADIYMSIDKSTLVNEIQIFLVTDFHARLKSFRYITSEMFCLGQGYFKCIISSPRSDLLSIFTWSSNMLRFWS